MQNLLILLPTAAYILLTRIFFAHKTTTRGLLEAIIKTQLVLFLIIATSVEILSSIGYLSFPYLLIFWFLLVSVCFFIHIRHHRTDTHFFSFAQLDSLTRVLAGIIVTILAATCMTALVYPPNTWDSMTYHMPRVVHWITNHSISFYPTSIDRQDYQMPLAEYAIMHLQFLTGSDIFANFIQWISFLVLICLSPLISYELGLNTRQQIISAIILATLPMAILQASSTQNDLVASSFVMAFGFFMLRLYNTINIENIIFTAIALGLALLTKGTAYIYCAAIGTFSAISIILKYRSDRTRLLIFLSILLFIVTTALTLNAGHLVRNYKMFGHPLSIKNEYYQNQEISFKTLSANILRNGVLHLVTPSNRVNKYLCQTIKRVLGSQLNNPKTTFPHTSFSLAYYIHEDVAGNLIHMLILVLGLLLLPIKWKQLSNAKSKWFIAGILFSAILYCLILKWQPWASRLHTPFFALATPMLTLIITSKNNRKISNFFSFIIIICLVSYSYIFIFNNVSRPLASLDWYHKDRRQLYFVNRKNLFDDYNRIAKIVLETKTREVGLFLGGDDWEYPFWALTQIRANKNNKNIIFKHVGVTNPSKVLAEENYLPLYVITTSTKPINNWKHSSRYTPIFTGKQANIFKLVGKKSFNAKVKNL